MYKVNEDLSIYVTRGDIVSLSVTAQEDGADFTFPAGSVLRIKVFEKKACENVLIQKDFAVEMDSQSVDIYLTEQDTRIGGIISKHKDYWYEVEMNPFDDPQTIIGYDEDGPKVFRLFPEGRDLEDDEIQPEDIPFVDAELDMTSTRPIQNQAVARKFASVENAAEVHYKNTDNPHKVTAKQLGLENVDNTSDRDKPVSTKQAEAIAAARDSSLPLSGGVMKGTVDMNGNKIRNLPDAEEDGDPVTKKYGEANYAPGFYGLGGLSTYASDPNTVSSNGFYYCDENSYGVHENFKESSFLHMNRSEMEMAQIFVNTLGEFGIRRFLAGKWSDIDGFAPSGYGLGKAIPKVISDANNALDTGWYKLPAGSSNTPSGSYGVIYCVSYDDNHKFQTWYNNENSGRAAQRVMIGGTWQGWEWVNPPMILGTEYSTIEKWNGNTVYTKLYGMGNMPNNAAKTITVSNATTIVRCNVMRTDYLHLPYDKSGSIAKFHVSGKTIEIITNYNASSFSLIGQVWYIKD